MCQNDQKQENNQVKTADISLSLENDNDEEFQNIVKYINNSYYDKYIKDCEIREALHLIKNKMEKENEGNQKADEVNEEKTNDMVQEIASEKLDQMPFINGNNSNSVTRVEHEKEWDNSVKPLPYFSNEEKTKKQIADKILKSDRVIYFNYFFQQINYRT